MSSCQSNVVKTLDGWWTIDTLVFGNYGDIRNCVSSIIIFKEDQSCNIPPTQILCNNIEAYEEKGKWSLKYTDTVPVLINIVSDNRIFKGTHEVYFYIDERNRLLKMAWLSDSLYMVCKKGMYSVDAHIKTVTEIIDLTNKELRKN
jgi:hypothetical protein